MYCGSCCMFLKSFFHSLQEFEDLDEITARYIQPMASFARDLLGHKYFQECHGGNKEVYTHLLSWVFCVFEYYCGKHNSITHPVPLPVTSLSPFVLLSVWQKMEELLVRTKREKPTFIPYFISACKDLPGKFILGYQPRGKPRWAEMFLFSDYSLWQCHG